MQTLIRTALTAAVLGCWGAMAPLMAQGLTGQITGTVTDTAGGVLPGVTVEATNIDTQASRTVQTNAEGVFTLPDLLPGTYNLRVSLDGFAPQQQQGIVVGATQRVALRTTVLAVGGFEDTVIVSGDVARVETTSAARSGTVTRDQIDDIASQGRNFRSYIKLLPGVIDTASPETPGPPGGEINGRSSFNFTMDGVTQKDTGANGGGYTAPSLDSIAEIRVQTSNFQAEYGRSSGASINVVTRSGSQNFHGSLAYYRRDDAFNGNEYSRRVNCENGVTAQCDPAPYEYNNAAWTFGGPVLIPGTSFNEDRNELFFFFSQDILPRKTPGNTQNQRVPTLLERQGDFSQTFDSQGRLVNVRDPQTGLACDVTSGGQGCFAGNAIPANRLDSIGRAYLNLMPVPNAVDPDGRYNFTAQDRDDLLRTDQILRADWNISPQATFYSRAQWGYNRTTGDIPTVSGNGTWPLFPRKWEVFTRGVVNTFLYSFSPDTFMEATYGLNWAHQRENPLDDSVLQRVNSGVLPGYQPFYPDANPLNIIPNASFNGGVPQNPANFSVGNRFPFQAYNRIHNTSANVTKVAGDHTIKVGGFWEYTERPAPNGARFNGAFDFGADGENPCDTNVGLANALTGCVASYEEANQRPIGHGVFNNVEWYVQDNWRVLPNLTLDLGVRFYHVGTTRAAGDTVAHFEPGAWNAAAAPQIYLPGPGRSSYNPVTGEVGPANLTGLHVPGTGDPYNGMVVYDEQVMDSAPIQIGPRLGIAWDVTGDGKTAVRAGYGKFFDRFPDHEFIALTVQPPVTVTNEVFYTTTNLLRTAPVLTSPPNVQNWPQLDPPITHNFSVGVQRDLGYQMILDFSYVGTRSSKQLSSGGSGAPSYDIPLNSRGYGFLWQEENFNPFTGAPYSGNQADHLRPLRGLGNAVTRSQIGTDTYDSFQLSLNKRRGSTGLSYGMAYTYQIRNERLTAFDPFISDVPFDHPHAGPNGNDLRNTNEATRRPHFLTFNYSWAVPNLSSAWDNPIAKILDDWQISGVTTVAGADFGSISYSYRNVPRAEAPFVGNTGGILPAGRGGGAFGSRVHYTCDPNLPRGERTPDRQFRTECIAPPTDPYNLGDSVGDELHSASLGYMNWDISLFKNIPLGGSRSLQLRVEMYNAFNTDQWTQVDTSAQFDYQTGEQVDANFGTLGNGTRDARRIQLAARFTF